MKNHFQTPVANYWDTRWKTLSLQWDLGEVSPPIKKYIAGIKTKPSSVLIPGCGNAYEAECLIKQGITNITLLDISPLLCEQLAQKLTYPTNQGLTICCEDFFEHQGTYDLILEQTFFCALPPSQRQAYVDKMAELLNPGGTLIGVLFNRTFDAEGPPWGGSQAEYADLCSPSFDINILEPCYNSAGPRQGAELFISMSKKQSK